MLQHPMWPELGSDKDSKRAGVSLLAPSGLPDKRQTSKGLDPGAKPEFYRTPVVSGVAAPYRFLGAPGVTPWSNVQNILLKCLKKEIIRRLGDRNSAPAGHA